MYRGLLVVASQGGGALLDIGGMLFFLGGTLALTGVLLPIRMGISMPRVRPFARYCRYVGFPTLVLATVVTGLAKL